MRLTTVETSMAELRLRFRVRRANTAAPAFRAASALPEAASPGRPSRCLRDPPKVFIFSR